MSTEPATSIPAVPAITIPASSVTSKEVKKRHYRNRSKPNAVVVSGISHNHSNSPPRITEATTEATTDAADATKVAIDSVVAKQERRQRRHDQSMKLYVTPLTPSAITDDDFTAPTTIVATTTEDNAKRQRRRARKTTTVTKSLTLTPSLQPIQPSLQNTTTTTTQEMETITISTSAKSQRRGKRIQRAKPTVSTSTTPKAIQKDSLPTTLTNMTIPTTNSVTLTETPTTETMTSTTMAMNSRQQRRKKRTTTTVVDAEVTATTTPTTKTTPNDIFKIPVPEPTKTQRRHRRKQNSNLPQDKKHSPRKRVAPHFVKTKIVDILTSEHAQETRLRSNNSSDVDIRFAYRNSTSLKNVYLCWMDNKGVPQDFNPVPGQSINEIDGPIIQTYTGHTFAFGSCNNLELCKLQSTMDTFHAAFRLKVPNKDDWTIQMVTLVESQKQNHDQDNTTPVYTVRVHSVDLPRVPVDTTGKKYDQITLGGWPVWCEPGCFDGNNHTSKDSYDRGISAASDRLPRHAREVLMKSTPLYINVELQYGPSIPGNGMCFHPDRDWLVEMGCSPDKYGSIEVYQCHENLKDMDDAGPGGFFLHELCHAYHFKVVDSGFENTEIEECYKIAMKEGLYDKVTCHGSHGKHTKAYACKDAMEYFSELSTAFLGGLDSEKEYNKWFPYNRAQVKTHDPRMYEVLKKVWKVECD